MKHSAIEVRTLCKNFDGHRRALSNVSIDVPAGGMVALIGASGSGKSTLLRQIAGLAVADRDSPSHVAVHGDLVQAAGRLAPDVRRIRSGIGFVFQQFNLVGRLPVMTNVMTGALHALPAWRTFTGRFGRATHRRAYAALQSVGMEEHAWQRTSTLSGGQQQRATIARALVQDARVILADEPIASLDPESSRRVMENLVEINASRGVTVVVSLHQVEFAIRYCPRTIALRGGVVAFDGPSSELTPDRLRTLYGTHADELRERGTATVDPDRNKRAWPALLPDPA